MLVDKFDESSDEEPEKLSTSTSLPALPRIPKEISSIPKPNISAEPSSAADIDNPPEPPDIQPNLLPETNSDNEDIICPPNAPTRPQRQRSVPKKFSEFVMYWIILFVFNMGAD